MAAELSSALAMTDLSWAGGWCRHIPPGDNRNRRLPHRTRVSALSAESWRDESSRPTSRTSSQRSSSSAQPSHPKSAQTSRRSEPAYSSQPEPEVYDQEQTTTYILSEVLKALRHHPEAKTAVREHFCALEEQVEREWLQQLESGNSDAE